VAQGLLESGMDDREPRELTCVVCGATIGDGEPAAQTDEGPAHLRCVRDGSASGDRLAA